MLDSLSFLIYKRGRVSITCFLWWTWLQQPSRAAFLSLPSGNSVESVASVTLQRGAAMQMEMGSIELTQDIISCQRFDDFLQLFYRNSLLNKSQVDTAFLYWIYYC